MIKLADVENAVIRRFATAPHTDDLDAATRAAIKFYSRYNPVYVEATLDVVEDTCVYDLPDRFICIAMFDWWPDGEVTLSGTRNALWDGIYRQSLAELRASEVSPLVRFTSGQIILAATPETSETVNYAYYGTHELSDGDYSTIPSEDLTMVVDLTTAELLYAQGSQAALDPDFSEGLLSIKSRNVSQNVAMYVESLRAGVKVRYGGY